MEKWFEQVKNKLWGWLEHFLSDLPEIFFAALVFAVFFVGAKYLRQLAYRIILRVSQKKSISTLFSTIFFVTLVSIGLFVSLEILHLEKTISSLLAGAGIIGLALGFAFQDLTANFISGVFIIFKKPFETGETVKTNDFTGVVEEIQLRSTILRTFQGLHITLPNKDIFQKPLINYSQSNERRVDLALTVSAKGNIDQLKEKITQSLAQLPQSPGGKSAEIFFTDYTGDSVKLEIRYWINNSAPENYLFMRDKMIGLVHSAIDVPPEKTA
jgi:small conductance mechanosensitive channel